MNEIIAGAVPRAVVELHRDIESLRGRMGESDVSPLGERQALGRACRDLDGLFKSLLVLSFVEGLAESFG